MLIFWTPTSFEKEGFLEDENGKFLPRNAILEALESAVVFYYIKKDKELLSEFNQKLQETKNRLLPLYKTNPYKKAIYETICEIEERIGV